MRRVTRIGPVAVANWLTLAALPAAQVLCNGIELPASWPPRIESFQPADQSDADLSTLSGTPVRFRFHVRNGSLYAFWVTPDASGASHGYVAAGGPGFVAATDTVGQQPKPPTAR